MLKKQGLPTQKIRIENIQIRIVLKISSVFFLSQVNAMKKNKNGNPMLL